VIRLSSSPYELLLLLLQSVALLGAVALSVAFYVALTRSTPVRSVWRLIAMLVGAEVSVFILLTILLPQGLMDEGELLGPLLLTGYLAPMFWRIKRDSQMLAAEKERAEVTLASIGDAVITTDLQYRVTMLNPVAERLTGWSSDEAKGRMLEDVFHVVDEATRRPADNPARRAIGTGEVAALAKHCILIARDGSENQIEDSAAPIRGSSGAILGCVLVFRDVSENRELMNRLSWQAGHDVLTGLPNRALLADRLNVALPGAMRTGQLLVLVMIDLDGFKPINDRHGHKVGDQLLMEVARRMQNAVRAGDTVARLGGDEFVLLLTDVERIEDVGSSVDRILSIIALPYELDGLCMEISASAGITIYPGDDTDTDTLLRHADQAMYQVKQHGRNHYCIFDPAMAHEDMARNVRINRIHEALQKGEFLLYYQPKVDMKAGRAIGLEALLRWQHPELGLLGPMEFLPLAEQTRLGTEIGQWVIREALDQLILWQRAGQRLGVSVNVSARHLLHPDFVPYLSAMLRMHASISPDMLEIEILETVAFDDLKSARAVISECQAMGVRIALDDFGTGYSSLAYMKKLPSDTIKIDQSFVRDMLTDHEDHALVEAVINLAGLFKKDVIAEGVESMMHGMRLMNLGCNLAQGYGIARPMPPDQVTQWLERYANGALWVN